MDKTTFGRTGIEVSKMGLGGGGPSRLGLRTNKTLTESQNVIRSAVDGGINTFDSSESYGTEELLGSVLKDMPREKIVVCTKFHGGIDGRAKNQVEVEATIDKSLKNLKTDYIDVYMLHAIGFKRYETIALQSIPSLLKMKEKGKIRSIGITEVFNSDRDHKMLKRALKDDFYDVIMVGFNILNSSARKDILKEAKAKNVGVFDMFAVRSALRNIAALKDYLERMIKEELLDRSSLALLDVVQNAIESGQCDSLADLAYRYCLHEEGISCVLSGTGSVEHLQENLKSTSKGPLNSQLLTAIDKITHSWDYLSAQ